MSPDPGRETQRKPASPIRPGRVRFWISLRPVIDQRAERMGLGSENGEGLATVCDAVCQAVARFFEAEKGDEGGAMVTGIAARLPAQGCRVCGRIQDIVPDLECQAEVP